MTMLSLAETLRHLNDAGATYDAARRRIASQAPLSDDTQRAVRHYWPILRSHTDLIGTSPEDAGLVATPLEWPTTPDAVCGYERHRSAWRGGHCAWCHPTATTQVMASTGERGAA